MNVKPRNWDDLIELVCLSFIYQPVFLSVSFDIWLKVFTKLASINQLVITRSEYTKCEDEIFIRYGYDWTLIIKAVRKVKL